MKVLCKILPVLILLVVEACGHGGEDSPFEPDEPGTTNPGQTEQKSYRIDGHDHVFGFTAQSRYSYCPSVVLGENGSADVYFCGNPTQGIMVDNIYHIKLDANLKKTPAVSVLQPGKEPAWDNQHTCDPSVIAGKFLMDGTEYKYAMFYLGCTLQWYYNEIGVAFANSLDAETWVKYPHALIEKTWDEEGDQTLSGGGKSWGVGQPSAVSLDKGGKVLLSYTIGDMNGTRVVSSELDLSDMAQPVIQPPMAIARAGLLNISSSGLDYTCNADIALDEAARMIYMIRPVQPHSSTYPAYINDVLELDRLDLTEFMNGIGTWTPLMRITPDDTGYPRNHNACIARDEYGHLTETDNLRLFYTVSKASPNVAPAPNTHAEWTYDIYQARVSYR